MAAKEASVFEAGVESANHSGVRLTVAEAVRWQSPTIDAAHAPPCPASAKNTLPLPGCESSNAGSDNVTVSGSDLRELANHARFLTSLDLPDCLNRIASREATTPETRLMDEELHAIARHEFASRLLALVDKLIQQAAGARVRDP